MNAKTGEAGRTLAAVFDFDDTLCDDSTDGFLRWSGLDTDAFWAECRTLLEKGFDPVLAYMNLMIRKSRARRFRQIFTRTRFEEFAATVRFFPGVRRLFPELRRYTASLDRRARIRFYLISSGLDTILRRTAIAREFDGIYASAFHFGPRSGRILVPKRVVSFTDKTRFLFAISKGIDPPEYFRNPNLVNRRIRSGEYAVPFSRMVFVGDGFSDIPCFAVLRSFSGSGIGVYKQSRLKTALNLIHDRRVYTIAPVDYSARGTLLPELKKWIRSSLEKTPS